MVKMRIPHFPIEKELKIPTMDKPLIIESAFPGWLPPEVNPNIPIKTDLVAREIVDSIRAGASVIHVHPRDPVGGSMEANPHLLKETLDPVFAECPDVVTWNHSWAGEPGKAIDYKVHTQDLLDFDGGLKYVQGSVVLIRQNPQELDRLMSGSSVSIKEGVVFLEEHGVKPIFQIYDTFGIHYLKEEVIEAGLAKWKPYVCNLQLGKHDGTPISNDPWALLQLLASLNNLREALPDCIVGVYAGGRNWLPIEVSAIMLGVDVLRVGMEDCLWVYPHRDEIIKKNSDMISKIATIARELGREVATPDAVRKICGMKKP